MASITIRNLDDEVRTRLRVRAAEHNRSMAEEVRIILREAVSDRQSRPPEPGEIHPRVFRATWRRRSRTAPARTDARAA